MFAFTHHFRNSPLWTRLSVAWIQVHSKVIKEAGFTDVCHVGAHVIIIWNIIAIEVIHARVTYGVH